MNDSEKPRDNSLFYITLFVVGIHVAGLLFLKADMSNPQVLPPKEPIVVTTIQLGNPTKSPSKAKSPPPPEIIPEEPIAFEAPPQPIPLEPELEPLPPPKTEPPQPEKSKEPPPPPPPEPVKKEAAAPKPAKKEEKKPKKTVAENSQSKPKPKPKPKKSEQKPKVAANQETKKNKKETASAKPKTAPAKKTESKQIAAEKPKEKKETSKKTETPPAPPPVDPAVEAAQAEAKAKQRELFKKAKESIAKIDKSTHKIASNAVGSAPKNSPLKIERLEIEAIATEAGGSKVVLNTRELGYQDELARLLKLQLRLLERGEVKVELTLERSGRVVKVNIINSESEVNKKHIVDSLSGMKFLSFGDNFSNESQHKFTITLKNDL